MSDILGQLEFFSDASDKKKKKKKAIQTALSTKGDDCLPSL